MSQELQHPPHSKNAEQAVLSAMLIDEDGQATALEVLKPEDFFQASHRTLFETIRDIYSHGAVADIVTLQEKLSTNNKMEQVGGYDYLLDIVDAVPSSERVEHYAEIVRNKATQRRLMRAARKISSNAEDCPYDQVESVVEKAESEIFQITESRERGEAIAVKDLIWEVFDDIEERANTTGGVNGVRTGFEELDHKTAGLKPGQLVIMAGRPSMGKSSLACNVACSAAIRHDTAVGIFSLEMSKEEIVERMLCAEGCVDSTYLRLGELSQKTVERLNDAAGLLNQSPIYIDDTPSLTPLELRAKARKMRRKYDIGLLIVDYLQLMTVGAHKDGNRQQEVSRISRSLKALAKELKVPVIALSQLSRQPEHRENKRPVLADLRESGAIEQDADVVIFVYRESVYQGPYDADGNDISNDAELIIGKQRNGETGTLEGTFYGKYMKFENF